MIAYAKYAAIALAVIGLFGFGWYGGHLEGAAQVARLQRDQAQALAKAYGDRDAKDQAYEKEIDALKTDSLQFPTVAVRMCPPTPALVSASIRQVLPAKAGLGTGNVEPVPKSPGSDYGPVLFGLADALDTIAAKCRED